MSHHPPPLGISRDGAKGSWGLVFIGSGKTRFPVTEPWTKRQAMDALRKEQGREVPTVSPQLRRMKTADVA